jgi:hypothetical protein
MMQVAGNRHTICSCFVCIIFSLVYISVWVASDLDDSSVPCMFKDSQGYSGHPVMHFDFSRYRVGLGPCLIGDVK